MILEWLHGIPEPPVIPESRRKGDRVPTQLWRIWISTWNKSLLGQLSDQDSGQVIEILENMLVRKESRWSAEKCLNQGHENGLFKRRTADGLVCASNEEADIDTQSAVQESDSELDIPPSPTASQSRRKKSGGEDHDRSTIILGENGRVGIWESV
jgi:hypothetical protein